MERESREEGDILRVIVLSKNRAAQLDQTLRSLHANFASKERLSVSVWYCFDTDEFRRGYELVQHYHRSVHFELQRPGHSIKQQLLHLIEMKGAEFLSFFVDDLVVVRPFDLGDRVFSVLRNQSDICALSLRLSPAVNHSQPLNLRTPPPPLDENNTWSWAPKNIWLERFRKVLGKYPATGDWRLQITPDGNVHRYPEFRDYFRSLPELSHINKLEWLGLLHPMSGSRMICYEQPKALVVAMNSVDPISKYPSGNWPPSELNRAFLSGQRLTYEHLAEIKLRTCHLLADPVWGDQSGSVPPLKAVGR